jgi:hypothetical protein
MSLVRVQREFIKLLLSKNIITRQAYRGLYLKSKGGYFRSKRHIKLYLEEHDELLVNKDAAKKINAEDMPSKQRKIINNK